MKPKKAIKLIQKQLNDHIQKNSTGFKRLPDSKINPETGEVTNYNLSFSIRCEGNLFRNVQNALDYLSDTGEYLTTVIDGKKFNLISALPPKTIVSNLEKNFGEEVELSSRIIFSIAESVQTDEVDLIDLEENKVKKVKKIKKLKTKAESEVF